MKEVRIMDEGAISRALTRISYEIIEQQKVFRTQLSLELKLEELLQQNVLLKRFSALEKKKVPVGEVDITLYRDDRHDSEETYAPVLNGTHIPFDIKGKQVVLRR